MTYQVTKCNSEMTLYNILCRRYTEELQQYQKQCDDVLEEVNKALNFLQNLQGQYINVSTKTNALHDACEDLLSEQVHLKKGWYE